MASQTNERALESAIKNHLAFLYLEFPKAKCIL